MASKTQSNDPVRITLLVVGIASLVWLLFNPPSGECADQSVLAPVLCLFR
jgi:hypothetical protein